MYASNPIRSWGSTADLSCFTENFINKQIGIKLLQKHLDSLIF